MTTTTRRLAAHRARHQEQSGAVLVEFAFVFILFVFLLWGLVTYGVVFAIQQSLEHAADEATRAGFGLSSPAVIEQAAEDIVNQQLDWLGPAGRFDAATGDSATVAPCPYQIEGETPNCLSVRVTFNWGTDALIPALFDVGVPDQLTATASVTVETNP